MQQDEQELYEKIKIMKRENELLMVLYEELDEMIRNGYTCSSCATETSGLLYSYREYKKWRDNASEP